MITYSKEELVSEGELAKHLSKFLNQLRSHQQEKIAVIRNNRLEAVLMPIEEYERLQEGYELLEHLEIYQTVKQREVTPSDEYLSHEMMLRRFEAN
jgi:PHD/YefM family antitoxin component YafN of YafNO toxin-antitoxin module